MHRRKIEKKNNFLFCFFVKYIYTSYPDRLLSFRFNVVSAVSDPIDAGTVDVSWLYDKNNTCMLFIDPIDDGMEEESLLLLR